MQLHSHRRRVRGLLWSLWLVCATPMLLAFPADATESSRPAQETVRAQQDRDLAVLRDLNDRVRRGDMTERERDMLWQAYVARVAAANRAEADAPARARFPVFTGPGL